MFSADPGGGFRFSDRDNPSQLNLFGSYQDEILTQDLAMTLHGKTLTLAQVKQFVLTKTPAYKYKTSLKILEERDLLEVVNVPPNRKKGTFPDKYMNQMQLRFL
jgi:hypothetical protein